MKSKNDAFLILRIPQELKDALLARANKKGVKLSVFIRDILSNGKKGKA